MNYINKRFFVEKTSVNKIAKIWYTCICLFFKKIEQNINNFKKSFKSINPLIGFSVKSNCNINILRIIKNQGLGADVVSMGELMIALKAGINPKNSFSGVENH